MQAKLELNPNSGNNVVKVKCDHREIGWVYDDVDIQHNGNKCTYTINFKKGTNPEKTYTHTPKNKQSSDLRYTAATDPHKTETTFKAKYAGAASKEPPPKGGNTQKPGGGGDTGERPSADE